jgi:hypothetical protein
MLIIENQLNYMIYFYIININTNGGRDVQESAKT